MDASKVLWQYPQLHSPTDAIDSVTFGWPASLDAFALDDSSINACIPGGLSQISLNAESNGSHSPSPSRSPSPLPSNILDSYPPTIALTTLSPPAISNAPRGQATTPTPHPYSISPSNTTALFTRASSVSSNGTPGIVTKKSRAPPSGPISTKDFIPPDVSGLSKREARLVKNRAAAFLSRQRKREEFELLEGYVFFCHFCTASLLTALLSRPLLCHFASHFFPITAFLHFPPFLSPFMT